MSLHDLTHSPLPPPLTALDRSFAAWLHDQLATTHPSHLWLAALVSHQWGRGHACLDLNTLQHRPGELLGWTAEEVQRLPGDCAEAASTLPWTQGEASPLVQQAHRLYLRRAWQAEQTIRAALQHRTQRPPSPPPALEDWLDALMGPASGHMAHDGQRDACRLAATQQVALITGGPGTGKTTTVARLLALLQRGASKPLRMGLAAPTGKAAARLSESIQKALQGLPPGWGEGLPTQAQTLHRLLYKPGGAASMPSDLPLDLLVVDEASMMDLEMTARLLQALSPDARLVLLGDRDQLASVEAGAVLAQLSEGPLLQAQRAHLLHSHRFDQDSGIGQWARAVRHHDVPTLDTLWTQAPHDFLHPVADVTRLSWPVAHGTQVRQMLQAAWRPWWLGVQALLASGKGASDEEARDLLQAFSRFSVLCSLREGPWGVENMNQVIAHALGLPETLWCLGRPVMVTRNNAGLGLMNGDVGLCLPRASTASGEPPSLRVAFPDGAQGVRWVAPSRLDAVETVFAMTVHKSQGSEFDHVLLVLPDRMAPVLTRELVYTGLTRARSRLTLWAPQVQVLWQACARQVLRSGGLAD